MLNELTYNDTGAFDEHFGTFLEDMELGVRAQRAGWKGFYIPQAVAFHTRGATTKRREPRWAWLNRYSLPQLSEKHQARYILNRYRLMRMYDRPRSLAADLPWILAYELRLWGYLFCFEPRTVSLLLRTIRRSRR